VGVGLSYRGSCLVAALSGDLDVATVPKVRRHLEAALARPGTAKVVLDLAAVSFMDSSGLGLILGRYRELSERGGSMAISGAKSQVQRVLQLSGIGKIMPVTSTVEDAIKQVGGES
jgi:stage II sporulation protein AA (anti-sigma F factor antagonist)